MVEKVNGRLIFIDEEITKAKECNSVTSLVRSVFVLSILDKLFLLVFVLILAGLAWITTNGIMNPSFLGKNYLDQDLFTSVIEGLSEPYLFAIWPAILLSLLFGIYSGIQAGYIKTKRSDFVISFICERMNEVLDSLPRLMTVFLLVFFVSAEEKYYQLYLLTLIGILYVPVVYYNFRKRVEWLVKQRFIDAEFIVGERKWRIKLIQIFWRNCRMLTLSQFFYIYSNIIITDACLGYLGVRQLRFPSLGGLIAAEMSFYRVSFLPVFVSAGCLSLLIIILNMVGSYYEKRYLREIEGDKRLASF